MHSDSRVVILVGAPNSGKTTVYNWLTGSKFRTVNYPGSTVEYSRGYLLHSLVSSLGPTCEVIDTPGIRSLDPHSPDEAVTVNCIKNENRSKTIVVVVDATQLERHLVIATRLQKAGFAIVVAITMLDLLKEKSLKLDFAKLSQKLQCEVVGIDGHLGGGIKELAQISLAQVPKEGSLDQISSSVEDLEIFYHDISELVHSVVTSISEGPLARKKLQEAHARSLKIDRVMMHPVFGLILFFIVMGSVFSSIFWLSQPIMDFIDGSAAHLAEKIITFAPDSLVFNFFGNGLVAGIGSVAVFLPQIVILFFIMGLLEDSGYLARAASLVDKPLSKIGLNGRSFVPLLSGYACAIPAMMAARTITNRRERLLTLFAIPLMSCSARLPVYALLLGLIFRGHPSKAGLGLTIIYFGSLVLGSLAVMMASRFLPAKGPSWFMLELPAYRRPKIRFVLRTVYNRTKGYVRRAGLTIVVISMSIWFLSTFPNYSAPEPSQKLESSFLSKFGHVLDPVMRPMGADWRVGVGLLSAFAARETFVSTMTIVFKVSSEDDKKVVSESLLGALENATTSTGAKLFTFASLVGLVIYFMIALQCLPTVAVARAESQSRSFALTQLFIFTIVAYVLAVFVVQGLHALGVA